MKQFEYQEAFISIDLNLIEELNAYGQEGWELIHYRMTDNQYQSNFHYCLFKREILFR